MSKTPTDLHPTDEALLQLGRTLQNTGYQFTTVTPATHDRVNNRLGNEWARDIQGVFGWSRPFRADILPAEIWQLMQRAEIIVRCGDGWRSTLRLSGLNGHLVFHSAYPTEEVDAVFFGPDTYRFARALHHHFSTAPRPISTIVDIGCGSGPGAILSAMAYPQAQVLAVDINDAALRLTRINAMLAGAANVETRHSNLLLNVEGKFDLMVANPPYLVDAGERAYRHGGGALGAGLSFAIVQAALERLAPGGTLILYTGAAIVDGSDPFQTEIQNRLANEKVQWSYQEIDPDVFGEELLCAAYAHADRIAVVVLTMTKTDG